jgi:hypothetical protein
MYLLKTKDEVFNYFVEFNNYVENQFNTRIKIFRSDNSTEFTNNNFKSFLEIKEFFIKELVYMHPNKMEYLKEKINIF